jgi:carbamoyl-phosphate synthase large subunit
VADALRAGESIESVHSKSGIDPWFLDRISGFLEGEALLKSKGWPLSSDDLRLLKQKGWTDTALAGFLKVPEEKIRSDRVALGVHASFHSVDTCAGEFEAQTPYMYSSYSGRDESKISGKQKVMILGGGPNRIGQGIEFDYCCVHAAMSLREAGYETLMVNSNPETVSTDFDISDKLYFEPLTAEHILNIARVEKPIGAIVQFGGQTPLKLSHALNKGGLKTLGTSTESIDLAEDREKCELMIRELKPMGLEQPPSTIARTKDEAFQGARSLGFPVVMRPSYVLGGQGMRIVQNENALQDWMENEFERAGSKVSADHPVLIDRFLNQAIEVDVDALSDGTDVYIGGVMEHIEEAGIHSGDSACSLPVASLSVSITDRIRTYTRELARRLKVVGLMNVQYAVQGNSIFLLEVNPRASRTVPFVSKAVGVPMAKIAALLQVGKKLKELGVSRDLDLDLKNFSVKAPVFPFHKFPGVDVLLGPEMKSTGEVMGRGASFAEAYAKALIASGINVPIEGKVFLSIRDEDKAEICTIVYQLKKLGFRIEATRGTAKFLEQNGIVVASVNKVMEGSPHCVERISSGEYQLVINTVSSNERSIGDSFTIRRVALEKKIPYCTVTSAARAMVEAIKVRQSGNLGVSPL